MEGRQSVTTYTIRDGEIYPDCHPDHMVVLNTVMEFDHVIKVTDGKIEDADNVHAPETYIDCDADGQISAEHEAQFIAELERAGWSPFTTGYSGQYLYRGPVMHASEYIGGRLERDILASPGLYVACVVECFGEDQDEPAGWIVLRRDLPSEGK
jgi:hypothetical protein